MVGCSVYRPTLEDRMIYRSDDICHETDVVKLRKIVNLLPGKHIFAVIPFGGLESDARFNENGEVVQFLRERLEKGDEIALHGYKHVRLTDYSIEEIIVGVTKGREYIEKLMDIHVNYFVPPQHAINNSIKHWIESLRFEILLDEGEDMDLLIKENRRPIRHTLWYHWQYTDLEKLEKWL